MWCVAALVLAGCSSKPVATAPEPAPAPPGSVSAADEAIKEKQDSDLLEEGVVASARVALGKPYLYGGTGQGTTGLRLLRPDPVCVCPAGNHPAESEYGAGPGWAARWRSHSMRSRGATS